MATLADEPGQINTLLAAAERLTKYISDGTVKELKPLNPAIREDLKNMYLRIVPAIKSTETERPSPPPDPAQARRRYLERLHRLVEIVPLTALSDDLSGNEFFTLDQVYVSLNTTTRAEPTRLKFSDNDSANTKNEKASLSALEAISLTPRMVLLGDPGSGKSTFARQLLAQQAASLLGRSIPQDGFFADLMQFQAVFCAMGSRRSQP